MVGERGGEARDRAGQGRDAGDLGWHVEMRVHTAFDLRPSASRGVFLLLLLLMLPQPLPLLLPLSSLLPSSPSPSPLPFIRSHVGLEQLEDSLGPLSDDILAPVHRGPVAHLHEHHNHCRQRLHTSTYGVAQRRLQRQWREVVPRP